MRTIQETVGWLLSEGGTGKAENTRANFDTIVKFFESHLDGSLFRKKVRYVGKIYTRDSGRRSVHSMIEFVPYYHDSIESVHTAEGKQQHEDYYRMRNRLLPEAFRTAKALKLADLSHRVSVRKHYAGAGGHDREVALAKAVKKKELPKGNS